MRDRGRAIKAHTLANLDRYLEQVEANVLKAGGNVFFAADAEAANQYVLDLARARGVKTVIKGKSMISEEMGLNHRLQGIGVEAVETDLGEYIIQLAEETPFHIVAPAIHKSARRRCGPVPRQAGRPPLHRDYRYGGRGRALSYARSS